MKHSFLLPLIAVSAAIAIASSSVANTFRAAQRMAGFSADGNYYVYLETSRDVGAGIPKATLQVVDVAANTCMPGGCIETQYREPDSGLSTRDAETDLLRRTWALRQELGLTPPVAGTRLSVISRSRTPDNSETVNVSLGNQQSLRLVLQQRYQASTIFGGTAEIDRSALRLTITHNGQQRSLGSLNNFRDWVLRYSIRDVYLSPDGQNIVVLISATKPTFEGVLETTLVQSFEL